MADERAQAYSFGPLTCDRLAEADHEWAAVASAKGTPFVRSMDDWDAFVSSPSFRESPLGALSAADLTAFRSALHFDQASRNGVVFRRCCSGWYYGDLVSKYAFSRSKLEQVAAMFGQGPGRFAKTADKFGDICNGEVCCRPRDNFNCPDGNPDCGC